MYEKHCKYNRCFLDWHSLSPLHDFNCSKERQENGVGADAANGCGGGGKYSLLKKQYTIADTKEFAADVRESIAQAVDSDGAITVDVLKIDREKGLCSIRVTADYVHPNGKAASVSCERTVIFDKGEAQGEKLCSISFYESVGGARYKTVFVEEGAILLEPVPPYAEGKAFLGWTDAAGNAADFSMQVTQDMAYYAKWN